MGQMGLTSLSVLMWCNLLCKIGSQTNGDRIKRVRKWIGINISHKSQRHTLYDALRALKWTLGFKIHNLLQYRLRNPILNFTTRDTIQICLNNNYDLCLSRHGLIITVTKRSRGQRWSLVCTIMSRRPGHTQHTLWTLNSPWHGLLKVSSSRLPWYQIGIKLQHE